MALDAEKNYNGLINQHSWDWAFTLTIDLKSLSEASHQHAAFFMWIAVYLFRLWSSVCLHHPFQQHTSDRGRVHCQTNRVSGWESASLTATPSFYSKA